MEINEFSGEVAKMLKMARAEWSVETMYPLLDVHYSEDFYRVIDKIKYPIESKHVKKGCP